MRYFVAILFLVFSWGIFSQGKEELCVYGFTGTYQGVNIYVQNPLDLNGIGFAVKSVEMNGTKSSDDIYGSAFMIDLSKYDLNIGDSVVMLMYHNSWELPRIVNTEALTPIANADVEKIWMESDTVLNWCSSNETQKFDYVIEQYRWNKWIKLCEVLSKGYSSENCYSFIPDLHSGENTLRVVQYGINGKRELVKTLLKPLEKVR